MSHQVEDSGYRAFGFSDAHDRLRKHDEETSQYLAERLGLRSARGEPPKITRAIRSYRYSKKITKTEMPCTVCGGVVPPEMRSNQCSRECVKAACRARAKAKGKAWATKSTDRFPLADLTDTGLRLRMIHLQRKLSAAPHDHTLQVQVGMAQGEFQRRQGG